MNDFDEAPTYRDANGVERIGEAPRPHLVSYKQAWIGRDRDGNPEYRYECHWSDGTMTYAHTLPWGRMAGAIDLDTGKVEQ